MIATLKQDTIDKARALGFTVSDRLEYRLETDTGLANGELVYFWNVIFPPDYPNRQKQNVWETWGLEALIRQYKNRFEDAKRDAEFSRHTIEGIGKLNDMLGGKR